MNTAILLVVVGSVLGLFGPALLPFITIIEEEANVPGWQTAPGAAAILLSLAALSLAAIVARRRRLQGLGGVLGLLAIAELALMAWTWADVWALVPCEDSGLALCDARTGTLMAETLVRLDWGVAAVVTGALAIFVGGLGVLLAHPEFGRDERFLRVRMAWQGGTLAERVLFRRDVVSLGEGDGATLQVPASGIGLHALFSPLPAERWQLVAPAVGQLELLRRGEIVAVAPGEPVVVERGDCGVLRLPDDLSVSFDFMAAETAVLAGASGGGWELVAPLAAVSLLALSVLLTGLLSSRRHDRTSVEEDLAQRKSALIEVALAEELPPEPEEVPEDDAPPEEQTTAKRAEGEEGKFGDVDIDPRRESKTPKLDAPMVDNVNVRDLGIAKVLGGQQALEGALGAVMAGDTGKLETKLAIAMAGEGVELEIGHGSNGMGFRGTGSGGGDPAGIGRIRGLGAIDTGGDTGRRARVSTGRKRRRKVADPAQSGGMRAPMHCDRGDIVAQVKKRASALRACYERELMSRPTLAGKVDAMWTIDLQGAVQNAKVAASSIKNARVEDCVLRTIRRVRFKVPDGGVCVVRWPFVFQAG
ncbi:MAG: hypothetical protein RIT45_2965 [Pseudomonadota bacterium]